MNNIILNIVSKKENLSYPLIFSKIRKYYWNASEIKRFFNTFVEDIIEKSIKNKWFRILKVLIHTRDDYALQWSSYCGDLQVVKFLVENGADIHAGSDCALRRAALYSNFEVVKYLVQNGANIHADDDYALRQAVENNHFQTVKFLVENGANIHVKNGYILRLAAFSNMEVIKYWIGKGADNNFALNWAAKNNHAHFGIIKYLMEIAAKNNHVHTEKENKIEK